MLNKPAGYLTAREDLHKKVVMELVPSSRRDLSPVGRLDEDTEGVLLITNDGMLNHRLLRPDNHVAKKYLAKVDTPLPADAKERLESPMDLKDFVTAGGSYEQVDAYSAYLTITEGKYHQVKRMFGALGCKVTELRRVSFGSLTCADLDAGECRRLTEEELRALKGEAEK